MNAECLETRVKIVEMFKTLTPRNVDVTKSNVNEHLLGCEECREFFKRYSERKIEEIKRSK